MANYIEQAVELGLDPEMAIEKELEERIVNHLTQNNEEMMQVVRMYHMQEVDSIRQYMDACRDDLVEIEQAELEVLQRFMPKDPTQAEVELEVNKFIADFVSLSGVSPTMKNMKDCMNYVHKTYPTANGGVISNIFKNKI